jgi:hypothetical protein
LPEVTIEGITKKMGMNRKTAHAYNKKLSGDFGQIRDVIILESTWLGYYEPYTSKSIISLVGQMMLDNKQFDIAKEYGLLPFDLLTLEPVRTICEKIMSLVRFSYGVLKGASVTFNVVFKCNLANPIAGQKIKCIVENNTKAGVKARLDSRENPFIIFLSRDHHYMIPRFSDIKEKENIRVKVLGQRFEINDPKISVIATLIASEDPEPDSHESSESETEQEGGEKPDVPDVLVLSDSIKKPGSAPGEHVSRKKYGKLDKNVNWRQRLCPLDVAEFKCNGSPAHGIVFKDAKWNTLEHFRHACIVYLHDPILAVTFCVGGKNGESPHHLESKYKHLTQHDKWACIQQDVLYIGLEAQLREHPTKRVILKDTAPAQLVCPVQGRLWYYEKLRDVTNE